MVKNLSTEDDGNGSLVRWNSATLWFLAVVAGVALLLCAAWGPHQAAADGGYVLTHSYVGEDFFSKWSFYVGADPTHGTVKFLSFEEASARGLISASFDRVYMGTDASEVLGPMEGRKTVRIESNEWFRDGLFVLDLDHAPVTCGAWPAFWMFGEDAQHAWPRWGEYDILEAIHNRTYAATTLHTRSDCAQQDVRAKVNFSGQGWVPGSYGNEAKDCFIKAPGEFSNQGCGQKQPYGSWGRPLNQAGGATWVAEWDPDRQHIRTWFFPRGKAPRDLLERRPLPSSWGVPTSYFSLRPNDCSTNHFARMRMVFDITFCGDWGGPTFHANCPGIGVPCAEFVQKNPTAFSEAFWSIRILDVYRKPSERGGVVEAPVGPYEPLTKSILPSSACKAFGILFVMLGIGCCGVVLYLLHKKAAMEDKSLVDAQTNGLATFTANLQMDDMSQCTQVNLQQLQQAEFSTRVRDTVADTYATLPEVSSWFQGTSRPVASHPTRNLSATAAQSSEHGAHNWVGYRSQPTRDLSQSPSVHGSAPPTGMFAAGLTSMASWWQEPQQQQPVSTRQPSLGRTTSSSSGQVCMWPGQTPHYVRATSPPQSPQGHRVAAATQAGTSGGGWSNWGFGAAQAYPGSPSHTSWSLPPTITALGPGAQRRT